MDTAKSIKEVHDFFGVMEVTYRFFSASVLRHGRFVKIQKDKGLKVLEIPHLSDTRWACHFFAVNLYKVRFSCLLEVLDEIVVVGNGTEAVEALGILAILKSFSFIILLMTFDSILGLTKPLSDVFQSKHLNLAAALEMVDSVTEIMVERRSDAYFESHIWRPAKEIAEHTAIAIAPPTSSRRTTLPSRLQDSCVLEVTGGRASDSMMPVAQTYKVIYFNVIDKILLELRHQFGESRPILQSLAALSPKHPSFLENAAVQPLAEEYDINITALMNQLDILKVML